MMLLAVSVQASAGRPRGAQGSAQTSSAPEEKEVAAGPFCRTITSAPARRAAAAAAMPARPEPMMHTFFAAISPAP